MTHWSSSWLGRTCLIALFLAAVMPGIALGGENTAQTLYGVSSSNIPPYQQWNGSVWSAAASTVDVGANPRWLVLRNCPTRNELLAVCSDSSNHVEAFTFNGTTWSTAVTLTTNVVTSTERPFYAAYEQSSGDALVAYRVGNTATLYYRTWNGSSWSSEGSVSISGAGFPSFIKLVPKSGADEIMAVVLDTTGNISALVWNGSSFGNTRLLESSAAYATEECVDAAYEQRAGRCQVVWSPSGSTTPKYQTWDGTSWLAAGTLPSLSSGGVEQLRLAADPAGDKIIAAVGTNQTDIAATTWSGSAWGGLTSFGAKQSYNICRSFDVAFEREGTRALCVFGQNYYPNWAYRKQIVIDHTKVSGGSSLTNFPVLIDLSADANLAANAQSSGNDILFTGSDGTTKLDHEIENYTSASGALIAWVKVPALSPVTDTVLYMYYGNAAAADQQNVTGVWSSNYGAVWHLDESAAPYIDVTGNANNSASGTYPVQVNGMINRGQSFNGTSHVINVPASSSIELSNYGTVSAWCQFSASKQSDLLEKGGSYGYTLWQYDTTIWWGPQNSTLSRWAAGTVSFTIGQWYKIDGVVQAGIMRLYINGALNVSSSSAGSFANNGTLKIGNGIDGLYQGLLDEVRISKAARTAQWIATEYRNQASPSTFCSLGAQTAMTNIYYRSYDGSSWSATQTGPATTSVPSVIQLVPSSNDSEIFVGASLANASLMFMRWDGSSLVDSQTLSSSLAGSMRNECFMFDRPRAQVTIINWREAPNPDPLNP